MGFQFRTQPFPHQQAEFDRGRDLLNRGILWEMGCGKTWEALMHGAHLYDTGAINGIVVVAPNGVHTNWVIKEIPEHLPGEVAERARAHWYSGHRHRTTEHRAAMERIFKTPKEDLAILAMSSDSLMTDHGKKAMWEMLKNRRCLYILDEGMIIKNINAKVTTRVHASSRHATHRRLLNGTPVSNGPFDLWAQMLFLDPEFWRIRGYNSYQEFKTTFASFKPITVAGGRTINVVSSYMNLSLLKGYVDELCTRVTKADVLPFLPPKLFTTRVFEMTPEQWRVYNELSKEFMTVLRSGEVFTEEMALTRLLRLQQVSCGYLPSDSDDQVTPIDDKNPRLDSLIDFCDEIPHSAIIWSRFRHSINEICKRLGDRCVRYDGSTSEEDRVRAIQRFQAGEVQFFVGNPQAAGIGLTLHQASTVIYESNDFNYGKRLQSEDRAHRIGQKNPVLYVDMAARGTVDFKVASNLVKKMDIACQLTGDSRREWFSDVA